MQFLITFLTNLAFLGLIGIVLIVLFPDQMRQVIELFGGLFGPIAVLILIAAALPRRSSRRPRKRRS